MAGEPIPLNSLPLFDPADFLDSEEALQAFLDDAKKESDPRWLPIALGHVERARERWGLPAPDDGPIHHS